MDKLQHNERVLEIRRGPGWAFIKRHIESPVRTGVQWKNVREGIADRMGKGFLFALVGPQGRGKTQIAVDLMLKASDLLKTSRYTSALGFFSDIKSCYQSEAPCDESEMLRAYCKEDLLVIDEFEKRSDNKWANDLIFEVLNRRYGMVKDTLLISNLSKEGFESFLGDSIVSRMNEVGGILECSWDSFREN